MLETAIVQFNYAPQSSDEIGLTYRENVQVLKKGHGWVVVRSDGLERPKDTCWDEEGWFPSVLC